MAKGRLGFVGILREALRISTTSPRLMTLAFLTSFPLFCSLLLNELLLQQTFLSTAHLAFRGLSEFSTSSDIGGFRIYSVLGSICVLQRWVREASRGLVLMSALYLAIVNPLDLLNSMMVVRNASAIYAGENLPNLREFFVRPLKKIGFGGPLVTSMYSLVLSCLTLLVIVSYASNLCGLSSPFGLGGLAIVLVFVAFFAKYMEWSVIWNTGIVISILEEKFSLRLSCLYFAWHGKECILVATVAQVCLVCLGNVVKWSVFMVYYCDCKKGLLEKKIDVEEGKAAQLVKR
ncbi:hypothetical protein NL676_014981 [Syzygium grande]|nr:hypothetical protein NL676_014981 [Syzygium grande]